MKLLIKTIFAFLLSLPVATAMGHVGWPANYDGVMLQGFYWDSYKGSNTTKWTDLTKQADELSEFFDLIWVPNSGKATGENGGGNGYMPIYWFSNHNCAFGTEAELKTMISTFKAKGVGFIEDVVVNHRAGATNWYNFPKETWNGKTYELTNGAICSTDEMWKEGGQGCPYTRGNADTGEDFNGARDLDHTNATVQSHIKDYCKFLLDDLGYVGFRLDMVKGYGGQYTKIYNEYSKPKFSVGEYWDGNYDAVAAWIEATGKSSAAFDFPGKYQLNKAMNDNHENLTELVWKANGTTDQPAGMIHFGYPQFAVTFVDNHDTYRDGSKFTGNVLAANAFILCSPGTPCVFWPHWSQYKEQIQAMIKARKEAGIHNMSAVKVLKSAGNIYMAEVTGTKGKLVVKLGSEDGSAPGGSYRLATSGNGYAIWITNSGGTGEVSKEAFTIYFDNTNSKWATPYVHYWGASESTYPGVAMSKVNGNVWSYTVPAGTIGILFNAGDGDATKTVDMNPQPNHLYTTSGDQGVYSGSGGNQGGGNNQGGNTGSNFVIYYNNSTSKWATPYVHYWGGTASTYPGVAMNSVGNDVWSYTVPAGTTGILFNAGDGDATKTSDFVAQPNHIYTQSGDQGVYGGAGGNQGGGNQGGGNAPATLYLIGNMPAPAGWGETPGTGLLMTKNGDVFTATNVNLAGMTDIDPAYFRFSATISDNWDDLSEQYGPIDGNVDIVLGQPVDFAGQPGDNSYVVPTGFYDITVDFSSKKVTVTSNGQGGGNQGGGDDNQGGGNAPATLYLIGNMPAPAGWGETPGTGLLMTKNGDVFTATNVNLAGMTDIDPAYFRFSATISDNWDDLSEQYGPIDGNVDIVLGQPVDFAGQPGDNSYVVPTGFYDITVDFSSKKVTVTSNGQGGGNQGGGDDNQGGGNAPATLYLIGNMPAPAGWGETPGTGLLMTKNGDVFTATNVNLAGMTDIDPAYFRFSATISDNWDDLSEQYGPIDGNVDIVLGQPVDFAGQPGDNSYVVPTGFYDITVDFSSKKVTVTSNGQGGGNQGGGDDNQGGNEDDEFEGVELYLIGNVNGFDWKTDQGILMTKAGNVYSTTATIDDAGEGCGYFAFATVLGEDWDALNSGDRYGAPAKDTPASVGEIHTVTHYPAMVNASASESWMIEPGAYTFKVDLKHKELSIAKSGTVGVDSLESENAEVIYFNLQGVKVNNPSKGIYIKVTGNKREKVMVR